MSGYTIPNHICEGGSWRNPWLPLPLSTVISCIRNLLSKVSSSNHEEVAQLFRFPEELIGEHLVEWSPINMNLRRFNLSRHTFCPNKSHHLWARMYGVTSSRLYADCKEYIALNYEGIAVAFIWFEIDTIGRKVIIRQLQWWVLSYDEKLKDNWFVEGFDWKAVLVKSLEHYIRLTQPLLKNIVVQSAENNFWVIQKRFESSQARAIYDRTARKLGYILEEKSWNYKKSLK